MFKPPPRDVIGEHYSANLDRVEKFVVNFPEHIRELKPYTQEYVFWTPAVLYLYGGLQDIVLSDHMTASKSEVRFLYHKFEVQLFEGLEIHNDPSWNYVLWFTPKEQWDALLAHLSSAMTTNRQAKQVCQYAHQHLSVPDPLCSSRLVLTAEDMLIPVVGFGVKSNLGTAAFEGQLGPGQSCRPKLKFHPPDERCCRYAETLFQSDELFEADTT